MESYQHWVNEKTSPYQPGYTINPPSYPKQSMGLGALGSSHIVIKRKFRWTLELKYKETTLVKPIFVKVSARPNLNIEEICVDYLSATHWIPGKSSWEDLTVNVYIDRLTSTKSSAYNLLNNFDELRNATGDMTGILRLYDGCGMEMENWELQNMIFSSCVCNHSLSDIDVELRFMYNGVKYTSNTYPRSGQSTVIQTQSRQQIIDKAKVYAPHLPFIEPSLL